MSDPAPALEIRGAALRRDDRELWAGLDLTVQPGELVAVLGPSGSGKTTLLRAILGLEPLSAGSITVLGEPVRTRGSRRVGYLPQSRPLPPDTALRGRDLVTLGVSGHRFGLPVPRRGDHARVDALIDAVGARDFADRPVGELSGGEQQRLRAGQALADEPGLLLCDEPLTSLDLANQQAVIGLIDPVTQLLVGGGIAAAVRQNGWLLLSPSSLDRASYSPLVFLVVVSLAVLLAVVLVRKFYHGRLRRAPAWDCGYPAQTARMQDTAEGFGQPIRQIFEPVFRMRRELPSASDATSVML